MNTRWSVRAGDIAAQRLITVGGIGTIVAVSLVFVYLLAVVAPLFTRPRLDQPIGVNQSATAVRPVAWAVDEYRIVGWTLLEDGTLQIYRIDTGELLSTQPLFAGKPVSSAKLFTGTENLVVGFADGLVCVGRIGFETEYRSAADVPEQFRGLKQGQAAEWNGGMIQNSVAGQFRIQHVRPEFKEPIVIGESPVRCLDHLPPADTEEGQIQAVEYRILAYSDRLQLIHLIEKENAFTGETKLEPTLHAFPADGHGGPPLDVALFGTGRTAVAAWEDGQLERFDTRNLENISRVESVELTRNGSRLVQLLVMLGRETLIAADSDQGLQAWFTVRDSELSDGFRLLPVHQLAKPSAAVSSLASSRRSRVLAVGTADGKVRMYHVTTRQLLDEQQLSSQPIDRLLIAPKEDAVLALSGGQLWQARLERGHPEVTWASLFRPVWYEGYQQPAHAWQSTYATAAPEVKLGLIPLVFGTMKATFYTMLFGAPLALLAAIYTSEFLDPRFRSRIKPAIEMMASLPSVVLGFIAALVVAPFVERVIPATLVSFAVIPLIILTAAQLFQLLPLKALLRWQRHRLLLILATLPIGIATSWWLSPWVERLFFAGDVRAWLDGRVGSGVGAWLMLWIPMSALLIALLVGTVLNPWLRLRAQQWNRRQFAVVQLIKFGAAVLATFALAWLISWVLTSFSFDPRGSYVGTYEQRNSLVVGLLMGFAVIPIIYTISDDALRTVPNHLRSASLGCGATAWQTAIRVVIPTAMSGLFSALMIGLGRAVGETMIVLMAAGNTPLMDWNIFNGFRTLSANIAVELPEAVIRSTHYRRLFLAALTLFVLTFLLNSVAELVRLRFRRRAYQL